MELKLKILFCIFLRLCRVVELINPGKGAREKYMLGGVKLHFGGQVPSKPGPCVRDGSCLLGVVFTCIQLDYVIPLEDLLQRKERVLLGSKKKGVSAFLEARRIPVKRSH